MLHSLNFYFPNKENKINKQINLLSLVDIFKFDVVSGQTKTLLQLTSSMYNKYNSLDLFLFSFVKLYYSNLSNICHTIVLKG